MHGPYCCPTYLFGKSDGAYVRHRGGFGELSLVSNIDWLGGYSVDTTFAH